jgi:hypothetical protein
MANFIVQTIYNPSNNINLPRDIKVLSLGQIIGILIERTQGSSHQENILQVISRNENYQHAS